MFWNSEGFKHFSPAAYQLLDLLDSKGLTEGAQKVKRLVKSVLVDAKAKAWNPASYCKKEPHRSHLKRRDFTHRAAGLKHKVEVKDAAVVQTTLNKSPNLAALHSKMWTSSEIKVSKSKCILFICKGDLI